MFVQDYWPRDIRFRDNDICGEALRMLEEDITFASIYSSLWSNVARTFAAVSTVESRLRECSRLLQEHSSNLFKCDRMISKKSNIYFNLNKSWCVACVCMYVCLSVYAASMCVLIKSEIPKFKYLKTKCLKISSSSRT